MKDSNFRPQRRTSILVVLALTFLLLLLPSTIVQQVAAVFENVCLQQDRTTEKGFAATMCVDVADVGTVAGEESVCDRAFRPQALIIEKANGDDRCNPSGGNEFARTCRRKCHSCCYLPQFRCETRPDLNDWCRANSVNCISRVNADVADPLLIRRLCPSWCGTCLEVDAAEEPGLCRDTVPLEECQQLIGQSKEACKGDDARAKCAFYCKEHLQVDTLCEETRRENEERRKSGGGIIGREGGEGGGEDLAENCPQLKRLGLCSDPVYQVEMQRMCARTCAGVLARDECHCEDYGLCGDRDPHLCKWWKLNGFCTNSFYKKGEIRRECGDTCGMCDGDGRKDSREEDEDGDRELRDDDDGGKRRGSRKRGNRKRKRVHKRRRDNDDDLKKIE